MKENPFGNWTAHRARIAAMSRADAGTAEGIAEARQLLTASRLADSIIQVRGRLSADQLRSLSRLLLEEE